MADLQAVQGMLPIPFSSVTSVARSERVQKAIASLASSGGIEARGAIYTKPEVVDFILDLASARYSCDLTNIRFLEPSFGGGEFLVPLIKRILSSWRLKHGESPSASDIKDSIVGFELHTETFSRTKNLISKALIEEGFTHTDSEYLSTKWLYNDDFLLANTGNEFNVVVGNPPYVRQELIPAALLREYRLRFHTFYDRADIYIPFIEKSLSLLSPSGVLGFICADRWMKNKYGGPLRKMISESFHFKIYVDMVKTKAFQEDVCAYPAISIITRDRPGITRIARNPSLSKEALKQIADLLISEDRNEFLSSIESTELSPSTSPWLLGGYNQVDLIRQIEADYLLLEDAGCKVGIGVATGADRVFIADYEKLDIESSRKLKLVRTRDISTGQVKWLGKGIVNPFLDNGKLVELGDFPRLERYFQKHRDVVLARHCAQKNPRSWYRTIDRITPSLATRPKLLVPDIKGESHVVYEEGEFYPHHNLYYIISDEWDLHCLQAVLMSSLTRAFVAMYSTRMRGGFLRFQAQYLRRLRIPHWSAVSDAMKAQLLEAAATRDIDACNDAVCSLYDIKIDDLIMLHEATL
ncbi:MAG: Eco57I restriction-modification methylase domain-containing protein [Cyanobacteriota bacterium]|jgi:hypothetical protein